MRDTFILFLQIFAAFLTFDVVFMSVSPEMVSQMVALVNESRRCCLAAQQYNVNHKTVSLIYGRYAETGN